MSSKLINSYNIKLKDSQTDEEKIVTQQMYDSIFELYVWHMTLANREGLKERAETVYQLLRLLINTDNIIIPLPYPKKEPFIILMELDKKDDGEMYVVTNITQQGGDMVVEYEPIGVDKTWN